LVGLWPSFPAEQHLAEQTVNLLPGGIGIELVQPFDAVVPFSISPV